MGRKCCCRNRFYDWSYNNPRIDRKLTDLHKRLSELDDILCARKKSEKKRKNCKKRLAFFYTDDIIILALQIQAPLAQLVEQ